MDESAGSVKVVGDILLLELLYLLCRCSQESGGVVESPLGAEAKLALSLTANLADITLLHVVVDDCLALARCVLHNFDLTLVSLE